MNLGFAGRFELIKQKVRVDNQGNPLLDDNGNQIAVGEPWLVSEFDNLITDVGLDNLGTDNPLQYIYLSTNNAEPTVNDSTIIEILASKKIHLLFGVSQGPDSKSKAPHYVSCNYTVDFAAGEGTGNIAKIGTGKNSDGSGLWSSALIKNNDVNTVINKLPDEILKVVYNLRLYINTSDYVNTVTISGNPHDVIVRVADFNRWGSLPLDTILLMELASVFDANISDMYATPLGNVNDRVFNTPLSYVPGSYEKGYVFTLEIGEGNFAKGIKSLLIISPNDYLKKKYWQISFTPPIMKTSSDRLSFPPFYIQWGRYESATT